MVPPGEGGGELSFISCIRSDLVNRNFKTPPYISKNISKIHPSYPMYDDKGIGANVAQEERIELVDKWK